MKIGFLLLMMLSILAINSCEYSPTGTNKKEIVIPDPNIDILVLNENEINVMRGRIIVYYSAELNGKEVRLIKVFLNQIEIQSAYNTLGAVEINTQDYSDGSYELTFQLFTSTQTGSLADITGLEVFVLTKKYNVQIFNAPITTPQITELSLAGNALQVKWNKYTGIGFQKYVLLYHNIVIKEIYDRDSTEIIDPAYVGGVTDRALRTYIAGQPFESTHKTFTSPQINFTSATVQNENAVVLTWQRNNFDHAFGQYRVTRALTEGSYLVQIPDINTTTCVDTNPLFGGDIRYGIEAVTIHPITTYPNPSYITVPALGQPFSFYDDTYIDYIPASDVYYTFMDDKISVYDNSFNTIIASQFDLNHSYTPHYAITNSSNGELIYVIKDFEAGEVAKINSSTLQIEQIFNLRSIIGGQTGKIWRIGISDNNILAAFYSDPLSPKIYLFNMDNGTLITSQPISEQSYSDRVIISPNGKYIKSEDNLFRLDGTTLTFIGNVAKFSLFLQDSESLVQFSNNKLQLINCANLAVLKEVSFQNNLYEVNLCVDKSSGYIGVESFGTNYFYVVDIHNQVIKKKMPVSHYSLKFQNMVLFSNFLRLKISF